MTRGTITPAGAGFCFDLVVSLIAETQRQFVKILVNAFIVFRQNVHESLLYGGRRIQAEAAISGEDRAGDSAVHRGSETQCAGFQNEAPRIALEHEIRNRQSFAADCEMPKLLIDGIVVRSDSRRGLGGCRSTQNANHDEVGHR